MHGRTALFPLFVVSMVALSGCSTTPSEESATTVVQTETTTATKAPETTTSAATKTTTESTAEPQYGDNLLYTSEVNTSVAMRVNASKRANFSELSPAQQDVFDQTYNCTCYVVQEEFRFNDDDRIEYVNYEGQWYFLRVAIV